MLESVRNWKTSEVELRHRLPQGECDWLIGALRARRGIAAARCASDARRLTIEYDGEELVDNDLVDFLSQCGVCVAHVRAGRKE